VGDKKYTAQVKPFSSVKKDGDKITILDTGNVKPYNVDWMIFINTKSNKILIIENNPIESRDQYVFDENSLIHEID
jgi:(p)ppGpp synthase/HD superfamily hydrolase